MKYVALLFVLMFSGMSYGASCTLQSTSGIPDSVVKELEQRCEKAKEEARMKVTQESAEETGKRWSAYSEASLQFAKAIGVAAREVGTSVNEFMLTPAGFLTMVVILAKVFGSSLIAAILYVFLISICFFTARFLFTREVEYQPYSFLGFPRVRKIRHYFTWSQMTEVSAGWAWCCVAFSLLVTGIAILLLLA